MTQADLKSVVLYGYDSTAIIDYLDYHVLLLLSNHKFIYKLGISYISFYQYIKLILSKH